jgi:hypothetical protein
MAAAVAVVPHGIDTAALSLFLDVAVPDLEGLVNSAADRVILLLQQVQLKARQYQEIDDTRAQLQVDYGILSICKAIRIR